MIANNSLVSIIIPVCNAGKYLDKCLASVILQSYTNWEIIIINDGSSDDSDSIVTTYLLSHAKQIKYIINDTNIGPGLSRNIGLSYACGKWLFFLDADDFLQENCLEKLVSLAIEHNSDIVLGNNYTLKNGIKLDSRVDLIANFKFSRFSLGFYAWGTLFERAFWQENKFLFSEYRYAEDLLLMSKIWSITNKIQITNDSLYIYRVNNKSATHKFYNYSEIARVLRSLLDFACVEHTTDELQAFALSNAYNFIKMVRSPVARYKLFRILKSYIPDYPLNNQFAIKPLISDSKNKKLKAMYKTLGLYFFIRIDSRIFKDILGSTK